MTDHYTASSGEKLLIAAMAYSYLKNAHAKAVRAEERKHENDPDYRNDAREAEIAAMAAEITRRDEAFKAEQEQAEAG